MDTKEIEEKLKVSMKSIEDNYASVKNVQTNSMDNIISSLMLNIKFLLNELKERDKSEQWFYVKQWYTKILFPPSFRTTGINRGGKANSIIGWTPRIYFERA